MIRRTFIALTAAASFLAAPAFAEGHVKDIVDTAVGAGTFTTLVAAVTAAGLVDTLKGEGPFTVFAPTDAAFAALPAGTVEDLLKPENKDKLVAILTYHVVPGKLGASDLTDGKKLKTVEGEELTVKKTGDKVMIVDAKGGSSFALFKGACQRGIYDNMKTAVETILVGKDRLYNRRFLQMCSQIGRAHV